MRKTVQKQIGKELVLLKEKHRYNIINSQTFKREIGMLNKEQLTLLIQLYHYTYLSNIKLKCRLNISREP